MVVIEIKDADGRLLAREADETEAMLYYPGAYQPGDEIYISTGALHNYVRVDQALEGAYVYTPKGAMRYRVPYGDALSAYPPGAFCGQGHILTARAAAEIALEYRNLAKNPADLRVETGAYPHATANVETRGEANFAARNAIDGVKFNRAHGSWPYQSWGIGGRADACLQVDFGRAVRVYGMLLTLRGDWPHDSHWTRATCALSSGEEVTFELTRTHEPQRVDLGDRVTTFARLYNLIKYNDDSPFPALTEWEIFGKDA